MKLWCWLMFGWIGAHALCTGYAAQCGQPFPNEPLFVGLATLAGPVSAAAGMYKEFADGDFGCPSSVSETAPVQDSANGDTSNAP